MDLKDAKPSVNLEDRTMEGGLGGLLRMMLDPESRKLMEMDNNMALLGGKPFQGKKYGAYIDHMLRTMSPDEIKALQEGHYSLGDHEFIQAIKKYGFNDLTSDPEFRNLFYSNGKSKASSRR